MKKLGCAKCGGTKKMQKGGTSSTKGRRVTDLRTKKDVPAGPDYVGPYSIKGTAGPVNETVSKARDIINTAPSSPAPYLKKGGAKKMQKGGTPRIYGIPQTGMTGPNKNSTTETMQSGGFKAKRAEKKITKQIKKSVKTSGDIIKAKFGASVPVQHSPKPGRVRSASGVGTVPVGTRKKKGGVVKKK